MIKKNTQTNKTTNKKTKHNNLVCLPGANLWQMGNIFPPAEWRSWWYLQERSGLSSMWDCLDPRRLQVHAFPESSLSPDSYQTGSLRERETTCRNLIFNTYWTVVGQEPNRRWFTLKNVPARMPLVTPGIPCISVTLLLLKYSSQVALRYSESQKLLHSLVVTVSLSISMTFAQTSYPLERRVRFPSRQTLQRQPAQGIPVT